MNDKSWMKSSPVELTQEEQLHLDRARRTSTAYLALEAYAGLFDKLDKRLGEGNEPARLFAGEYVKRQGYAPEKGGIAPTRPGDKERVELMEASFLWRRLYPKDVGDALAFDTLQKYIPMLRKAPPQD